MRTRIGIGISCEAVRAVAVRRQRVLFGAEVAVGDRSVGVALDELLLKIGSQPGARWWLRPRVSVAVGPSRSQLRRLSGLPPVAAPRALAELVSENAGRFFLRNGIPIATSGVLREGGDGGWSAAVDQPVIGAVADACRAHRLRLSRIFPSVAILNRALVGDALVWRDGDTVAEIGVADGRVRAVRRVAATRGESPCSLGATGATDVAEPLSALGADAWRFADAYAAAVAEADHPLGLRAQRAMASAEVPSWRLILAGCAFAMSLLAALVAPSMARMRAAAAAARALEALSEQRRASAKVDTELALVNRALLDAEAFSRQRHSATLLVAQLAHALPDASALVTLRADSTGGTLVALTPRAAQLVENLNRAVVITSPTIIGPITREVAAASGEVERVTIRFRWADSARTAPIARSVPSND